MKKIAPRREQTSLPSRVVNVLQSMLVYCMFLDEHVNHEPQIILYFQHKLASLKWEISCSY